MQMTLREIREECGKKLPTIDPTLPVVRSINNLRRILQLQEARIQEIENFLLSQNDTTPSKAIIEVPE